MATISNQGRIKSNWTRYYADLRNDVKDYTYHIWYLDSVVIIEYRQIEFDMGISDDNKSAAVLKTKKYIYRS